MASRLSALFHALRRRKIPRIVLTYLVVGLAVIEGADLTFPILGVGDGWFRGVVLVVLLGLPVAAAVAWGLEAMVDDDKSPRVLQRFRHPLAPAVVMGLGATGAFILLLGVDGTYSESPGSFDATEWVIGVFPSAASGNERYDRDLQLIEEGMTQTVTSKLSQLSRSHELQVVPTSALREAGVGGLAEARTELGVTLALAFDTHRLGDRLRINAQLIDIPRKRQIAAEVVDGSPDDLLELEERLTLRALEMLRLELGPAEPPRLRAETENPQAYNHFLRGKAYLEEIAEPDVVTAAITRFEEAIRLDPEYAAAHAGLGRAFWARYRLTTDTRWVDAAVEECRTATRIAERDPEGHVCLGTVFRGMGRYEDAVREFRRATQLDPTSDDAFRGLARAHGDLGQTELAEEVHRRAISLRPHYWGGWSSLGYFYYRQGRFSDAIRAYEEAVRLAPENYRITNYLGAMYYYAERWGDAERAFERALELKPDDAGSLSNLGTLRFYLGRYEEAARAYERAVTVREGEAIYWVNLGDAYHWSGADPEKERSAYERALELVVNELVVNPRDARALSQTSWCYAMLGNEREALDHLARALREAPDDMNILQRAASIHHLLGDDTRALDYLAAALEAGYPATEVRADPVFGDLQGEERFEALFQRSEP